MYSERTQGSYHAPAPDMYNFEERSIDFSSREKSAGHMIAALRGWYLRRRIESLGHALRRVHRAVQSVSPIESTFELEAAVHRERMVTVDLAVSRARLAYVQGHAPARGALQPSDLLPR